MRYFANAGPDRGPLLYDTVPKAIRVLEDLDRPIGIGLALRVGADAAGSALWELVIDDVLVPGCWIVVDREFKLAE